jgi:hypothetical protein
MRIVTDDIKDSLKFSLVFLGAGPAVQLHIIN